MLAQNSTPTPLPGRSAFGSALAPAREAIQAHGGSAIIPLPISVDEASRLLTLTVGGSGNWDYFGSPEKVTPHLDMVALELGNSAGDASEVFSRRVTEIFAETLDGFEAKAGWLCLRGIRADASAKPRWHTDGNFFLEDNPDSSKIQMKLAFCVKGRSTLSTTLDVADRAVFDVVEREVALANYTLRQVSREADPEAVRNLETRYRDLQEQLNSIARRGQVVAPRTGIEALLFAVGQSPKSGLHSEPPFDEARIFASIVPGTAAQIAELQKRWQAS